MGGATVFPGGTLTEGDADPAWSRVSKLGAAEAARALREQDQRLALAHFVCALREAFEEVGFILGDGPLDELDRDDARDGHSFLQSCLAAYVVLATDRLVPAGRWEGPPGSPVRFDARFFAVRAPQSWEPVPDPAEVASCRWALPSEVLSEFAAGRAVMAPPTVAMLQKLQGQGSVDEALTSLRDSGVEGGQTIYSARVGPGVRVVIAPNPSVMTGPGTNTYVVGTGPHLVIDPAVDDEIYLEAVIGDSSEIAQILVTHRHSDHIGGVSALAAGTGAPVRAYATEPIAGVTVQPVEDQETIEVPGARLQALHSPGHAQDHLCFFDADARALFAGDVVLGEGTSVIAPPEGSMRAYLETLERLRALRPGRIYPGHFRVRDDGETLLRDYVEHRRAREKEILVALANGARTVDEIVASAYVDTPIDLHPIARYSASAHLKMLEEDGRVKETSGTWVLSDE